MIRNHLDQLEIQGKWDEAVNFAFENRSCVDALCRCIFYGWYLYLESPCITPEPQETTIDAAQKNLGLIYDAALTSNNPTILREIGYGMCIAPYLFPGNPDINEHEYPILLKTALQFDPTNMLLQILYDGAFPAKAGKLYSISENKWITYISLLFPSEGEYDRYYRSVLQHRLG